MTRRRAGLVAGVDFGSDSVRVAVVDTVTGATMAATKRPYSRWLAGEFCSPQHGQFRQHPLDHLEALEGCFEDVAELLGPGAVRALAVDTTGSTPAPVDRRGVPLALSPGFEDNPDAMFWLWKDRTATAEALRVDRTLSTAVTDHTAFQGRYSSEWWWAKILRGVTRDERIRTHAHSWLEHSDWLPNLLVGAQDVSRFARNSCAAGHKALHNRRLGGPVPAGVLAGIDPALAQVGRTSRLPPVPAGTRLGTLCPEWADRLRLGTDTVVGVGSLDAHAGGVGAGIDARTLVKVMGTSTVDLFLADHQTIDGKDLRHVCGIAEDSIIPGRLGGESGQAAFGDLFAWFADLLAWPSRNTGPGAPLDAAPNDRGALLAALDREAARRGPRGIVAVDWINGRRYPDADEAASGALLGLRIGHDAVDVYRALVEAAVLGSKAIHEALTSGGLSFDRVVLVGGIASKSPHIRQSVADALGVEVMTCPDQEVCARGAALYAAVAAGIFESVPAGQERLCAPFTAEHRPSPRGVAAFEAAFHDYRAAGRATAAFGAREQSLR